MGTYWCYFLLENEALITNAIKYIGRVNEFTREYVNKSHSFYTPTARKSKPVLGTMVTTASFNN